MDETCRPAPGSRGGGSGRGCFAKAAVMPSALCLPSTHTSPFHCRLSIQEISLQTDLAMAERNNLWHISWGCFDNEKSSTVATPDWPSCFLFIILIIFLEIVWKKHQNKSKTMAKYQSSDKSNFEIWCLCSSVGTVDINNSTKYYSHYYIWQHHNSEF